MASIEFGSHYLMYFRVVITKSIDVNVCLFYVRGRLISLHLWNFKDICV